jgi:two-component system OmpR family sensor kinase
LTAAFAAAGTADDRALAPSDDALFGAVATAAAEAVERVRKAAGERAQGEERLRAFLADAGHELRTPLAIAIGYIGILQRDAIEDPELARRIVGDIATEHERLTRLVERILQLARLDAVAADPSATCDAVRVAREAIALVRPLDIEREIALNAPDSAWLAIAPDDFRDAVRNLLENALRYAPGSDIAVTIVSDGKSTIVRVADNGPGMTAFARDHAFDRFFRGSATTTAVGSGLGLAIVRRIAERAGGIARLDSEEDRGTVAELQLPAARSM